MGVLNGLKPEKVFEFFEEISRIPRGSGNVKNISDYCVNFAKERNLNYIQDESYNVIIMKPGNKCSVDCEPVIIQGHLDMVCVKNQGCTKDMENEGIDLLVDGDYVKADNTTLGADDGIAVAYALALLDDNDYVHPPIEAVFTVDEETGMTGADNIDLSCLKGHMMLNIDSEEEGIFLSSCAGGATVRGEYPVKYDEELSEDNADIKISVNNLTSGHSGTDIIFQRANAINVTGRILFELSKNIDFRIVSIDGGEKDNSIPPFAETVIRLESKDDLTEFNRLFDNIKAVLINEYMVTDKNMNIESTEVTVSGSSLDYISTSKVILALTHIENGVIKMSNDIKGLVQTSLNLGVLKCENDSVVMTYLIRSSLDSEKEYLIDKIKDMTELIGGEFVVENRYPAWEYRENSHLREVMAEEYRKLYKEEPKIEAIHAGVECGIMASKIDNLDCVSFGPEILDIHTPKERMSISSVERTWRLILNVLENLA